MAVPPLGILLVLVVLVVGSFRDRSDRMFAWTFQGLSFGLLLAAAQEEATAVDDSCRLLFSTDPREKHWHLNPMQ